MKPFTLHWLCFCVPLALFRFTHILASAVSQASKVTRVRLHDVILRKGTRCICERENIVQATRNDMNTANTFNYSRGKESMSELTKQSNKAKKIALSLRHLLSFKVRKDCSCFFSPNSVPRALLVVVVSSIKPNPP